MYKFKNMQYDSINDMLKAWDKAGANRFYSMYINNNRYEGTYITLEQLNVELKRNNNCYTFYKSNPNKGYGYRDASKIKVNEVDRIEIRNNKGMYGNITNGFIVMVYNGNYVKLD